MIRCDWAGNELLMKYHDTEWGVPVHTDKKIFEFLILEGFQAGLSWQIIINKRVNFRKAFHYFDPLIISEYTQKDVIRLLNNSGIIRNKLKINAAIFNARKFLEIKKEFGSFNKYIWQFVNFKPIKNKYKKLSHIPAITKESDKMSLDLKKRGFRFVGSAICYAHMQATGMVNDHLTYCFRHNQV